MTRNTAWTTLSGQNCVLVTGPQGIQECRITVTASETSQQSLAPVDKLSSGPRLLSQLELRAAPGVMQLTDLLVTVLS